MIFKIHKFLNFKIIDIKYNQFEVNYMSENQTNSEKKIYDLILIRTIINMAIFLAFVLIFNVNITDST